MKYIIVCFTIILVNTIFCQSKSFNLGDTNLVIGQEFTTRQIHFDLGKANLKSESTVILDSIVTFMVQNKNVTLEIGVHSDKRSGPPSSSNLTHARARNITQYLKSKGISISRIIPKGYGSFKLLVTQKQIDAAKTKEEKETLHAMNRRVVLKVISN